MNVIVVLVGVFGAIPKKLQQYVEKEGIEVIMVLLQKVTLLGTARILRQVYREDFGV